MSIHCGKFWRSRALPDRWTYQPHLSRWRDNRYTFVGLQQDLNRPYLPNPTRIHLDLFRCTRRRWHYTQICRLLCPHGSLGGGTAGSVAPSLLEMVARRRTGLCFWIPSGCALLRLTLSICFLEACVSYQGIYIRRGIINFTNKFFLFF